MIVISLGGSCVSTGAEPDVVFLGRFIRVLKRLAKRHGARFLVIVGGGALCRNYQAALRGLGKATNVSLDRVGIGATYLNAVLIREALGPAAYPQVLGSVTPSVIRSHAHVFFVSCGTAPGWSTDYVSVDWAMRLGIPTVFNLSNIDRIYTSDVRQDPKARPFTRLDWAQYLKIIGRRREPGMNVPIDPKAAILAKSKHIAVHFMDGHDLASFKRAVSGLSYRGTTIVPTDVNRES